MKNINQVIEKLNKDLDSPKEYEIIADIVEKLQDIGSEDKVHAFYDEYISLDSNLGSKFMDKKITEINTEDDEDNIDKLLEVASNVIPLFQKESTEEDLENIEENKRMLGIE